MREILIFFVAAIKQQAACRFNAGAEFALSLGYFAFQTIFLSQLFSFAGDLAGWNEHSIYTIFYSYMVIGLVCGTFFDSIEHFFRVLHEGQVEPHLVVPATLAAVMFLRWCNPVKLAIAALLIGFGPLLPFATVFADMRAPGFWLYWLVVLIAVLANIAFFLLLHLPTFFGMRVPPADYIHSEVQQMSILPAGLFPSHALSALLLCVPVAFGASIAAHASQSGADRPVLMFIAGAGLLIAGCVVSTRRALRQFDSLGG